MFGFRTQKRRGATLPSPSTRERQRQDQGADRPLPKTACSHRAPAPAPPSTSAARTPATDASSPRNQPRGADNALNKSGTTEARDSFRLRSLLGSDALPLPNNEYCREYFHVTPHGTRPRNRTLRARLIRAVPAQRASRAWLEWVDSNHHRPGNSRMFCR